MFIYSYPLSNRGAIAKASGAEVLVKHDDVVLIQLVLTQLAKCSPFPQLMVSQAGWPQGEYPWQVQTSQIRLFFGLFMVGRPNTSDFLRGNCLISNSMV